MPTPPGGGVSPVPDLGFSKLIAEGGAEPGAIESSVGTRFERTRGGRRGGIVMSAAEAGLACGGAPESLALGGGPPGAGDAVRGREGGGGVGVGSALAAPACFNRILSIQNSWKVNHKTLHLFVNPTFELLVINEARLFPEFGFDWTRLYWLRASVPPSSQP